jgi:ketosteroid isomerase-like protein
VAVPSANWFRERADAYNSEDIETFFAGFDRDVVFIPDPEWPEPGPFVGRDAFAEFLESFRGAWEEDRLEVESVEDHDAVALGRCRWIVSGAASGAPVPATFSVVVRLEPNGLASRVAAFFDHDEALRWAEAMPE